MINCKNFTRIVCEEFEDFLTERGVNIPNSDRTGDESDASIFGSDWDDLLDVMELIITDYLKKRG